jgi:hypothetical protein
MQNTLYRLIIATSILILAACAPATAVNNTSNNPVNTTVPRLPPRH